MNPRFMAALACALVLDWGPGAPAPAWPPDAGARVAGADALETGPLPAAVWWNAGDLPSLSHEPLGVLSNAPRFTLEQEWAPLYSDRSGARIDCARRTLTARAPAGWLRNAAVIETRMLAAETPTGAWRLGAERPGGERGFAVLGVEGSRAGVAAAVGAAEWRPGMALAGRAILAPGWRAEASWSRWTIGGSMDIAWNEDRVLAAARWTEQRAGWRIDWGGGPALGAALEQRAIDCDPASFDAHDRAGPGTAWRATRMELRWPAVGARWKVVGTVGEGHEALRFWRDGTAYALAEGPVRRADAELHASFEPWEVRAWGGRWRGEARGAVALWPFDGLAGAVGSRRVAASRASLEHAGLSVERAFGANGAWQGGLAAAWLVPHSEWETWQAPLFGLGRSDATSGETDWRDALALGAKVGAGLRFGDAMFRAEVVQWVPVMVREWSRKATAPGAPSGADGPTVSGTGTDARGGTIVRLTLEGSP